MKLSIAIMHAPWAEERVDNVRELLAQLPNARVISDPDRRGVWDTAIRAWSAVADDATHHLVLQDDVQLCNDFETHVKRLVAQAPDAVITLFMCLFDTGALGMCMPAPKVREWLAWTDQLPAAVKHHDDMMLRQWLAGRNEPLWFAYPCLVEARGYASTVRHPQASAMWFEQAPISVQLLPYRTRPRTKL